ncbi:MAG: PTS fructose IIA subunit family protein [Rhodanobacteraceae bacterium]
MKSATALHDHVVNAAPGVGVLLVTHEAIGQALVAAARHVMPHLPLRVAVVEIDSALDPAQTLSDTAEYARALDAGGGVLVLSDLYGATPCNVAQRLGGLGVHARCVSGLNLPMLLRVLNYAEKSLDELAEIAASGGRGGIFIDKA